MKLMRSYVQLDILRKTHSTVQAASFINMDHLILQIYSQASASHVDIFARQKLLVENLDRIFADQGDVETWEYHEAANTLKEFVITSVADFDRKRMVRVAPITY
jgi:hypothetical protein